jgi:hypothetical protein
MGAHIAVARCSEQVWVEPDGALAPGNPFPGSLVIAWATATCGHEQGLGDLAVRHPRCGQVGDSVFGRGQRMNTRGPQPSRLGAGRDELVVRELGDFCDEPQQQVNPRSRLRRPAGKLRSAAGR